MPTSENRSVTPPVNMPILFQHAPFFSCCPPAFITPSFRLLYIKGNSRVSHHVVAIFCFTEHSVHCAQCTTISVKQRECGHIWGAANDSWKSKWIPLRCWAFGYRAHFHPTSSSSSSSWMPVSPFSNAMSTFSPLLTFFSWCCNPLPSSYPSFSSIPSIVSTSLPLHYKLQY